MAPASAAAVSSPELRPGPHPQSRPALLRALWLGPLLGHWFIGRVVEVQVAGDEAKLSTLTKRCSPFYSPAEATFPRICGRSRR